MYLLNVCLVSLRNLRKDPQFDILIFLYIWIMHLSWFPNLKCGEFSRSTPSVSSSLFSIPFCASEAGKFKFHVPDIFTC